MKNTKPVKVNAALEVSQFISSKDVQAMITYLRNFDLKYNRIKSRHGSNK